MSQQSTILIIDDNPDVTKALEVLLELEGFNTQTAHTPEDGLQTFQQNDVQLIIQDMNFSSNMTSGNEGIALFQQLRDIDPDIPVILITAWTNLETAVELVKNGAADYIGKPWDDQKLIVTVKNLLELYEVQQQQHRNHRLQYENQTALKKQFDLCGIRYQSALMDRVVTMATQVARSDVPVLITGPNGAGKEKIAEIIQANSDCRTGPFIKVNVGALPTDLLEAELFGAEAGAFTGSTKRRTGRFEAANNGTLFLDEIGNLSHEGQVKLLRVIQTGEFERIGSNETQKVSVRIISATNSNLIEAIAKGEFREDLYYRLNVIELNLPSLSARKDDILLLANHFLTDEFELSHEAADKLKLYHWPGNVRELQNVIKRAMLLSSKKVISADVLGIEVATNHQTEKLAPISRQCIINALKNNNGNIVETAKSLGLSRSALYRRLKKFEIEH